jgi:DNA polymerase elongation subunit (family B)
MKKWTKTEEKRLKELAPQKTIREIAEKLKLDEWVVRNKMSRMKLKPFKKLLYNKSPKILVFDIETAPMTVYTWGLYDQNIGINQIENDWFMLCYSAKWLFEKEVLHNRLTPKEAINKNDKRITKSLWKLLDEADIVIAHNGNAFDIKKTNARFLFHGMNLPSPYKSIDTLKIARKIFKVTSNKLDYLCEFLGINKKIDTGGFELWHKCVKGDSKALEDMDIYCRNDVEILEELYLRLRKYDKSHPNLGIYLGDKSLCPNCGSDNIVDNGFHITPANKYVTKRCVCGAIIYTKEKAI